MAPDGKPETKKLNERNVRLWKPFFSFKCLFASVNLNTSLCKETILDS